MKHIVFATHHKHTHPPKSHRSDGKMWQNGTDSTLNHTSLALICHHTYFSNTFTGSHCMYRHSQASRAASGVVINHQSEKAAVPAAITRRWSGWAIHRGSNISLLVKNSLDWILLLALTWFLGGNFYFFLLVDTSLVTSDCRAASQMSKQYVSMPSNSESAPPAQSTAGKFVTFLFIL